MSKIGTRSSTRDILNQHDLRAKKRYGQNFLVDHNMLRKIVSFAAPDADTLVVEIGPGIGGLTEVLLEQAGHVLAYEIDDELIPILEKQFRDKPFTLIHDDILKRNVDADIDVLPKTFSRVLVIANLPYYITTPILTKLLEESKRVREYHVMMQYEVARRFTSPPATKDYNSLSVFIQFKTEATFLFKVPKQVFEPAPNVDSAVVKLLVKDQIKPFPTDEEWFYKVVRGSFVQRRKTLPNNLQASLGIDKATTIVALESLGLNPSVRAEHLSVADFVRIADRLLEQKDQI